MSFVINDDTPRKTANKRGKNAEFVDKGMTYPFAAFLFRLRAHCISAGPAVTQIVQLRGKKSANE